MNKRTLSCLAAAVLLSLSAAACSKNAPPAPEAEVSASDARVESELREHLPDTLTFTDRMGAAGIARLAEPLDLDAGDRLHEYRAGDVAYWPAEQSIIVFRHSGSGAVEGGEVILLGELSTGFAEVADCVRGCRILLTVAGDSEQEAGA